MFLRLYRQALAAIIVKIEDVREHLDYLRDAPIYRHLVLKPEVVRDYVQKHGLLKGTRTA